LISSLVAKAADAPFVSAVNLLFSLRTLQY
jgi:hypothetical protein